MSKLQILIGCTRPTRAAGRVAPWIAGAAQGHGAFEVEVLDLRDWDLPFFQEHLGTIGDWSDPSYSEPVVRAWNHKLAEADAFVIVTTEDNHSVPGEPKNALDSVWLSFALRNKPVAFAGYSVGIAGGSRAVEHLALSAIEAEAVPLRNSVLIPFVGDAFGEDGEPRNPASDAALTVMLDDLAWWAPVLARARAEGQLPPAAFRNRAAAAVAAD